MERKIGETFNVLEHHPADMPDHLVTVRCVEDNSDSCTECALKEMCYETFDKHGYCSSECRNDKKNVAFIKVKEIEV